MNLSKKNLKNISAENVKMPDEQTFNLPETVLQFGTGMLLRGLPDYHIDRANRNGVFNGRIVVVKSTHRGDTCAFEQQDALYTVCIRGVQGKKNVEEFIINSAISRVLNANNEWSEILNFAKSPALKTVISNTTEMGLQLDESDNIQDNPPQSFPGKLLAVLLTRFNTFNGDLSKGLTIIPTELLPENGKILKKILLSLARVNHLKEDFINWLVNANRFCSSLVDRIVTGMPSEEEQKTIFEKIGYTDRLLNVTEVYNLWAIEGDDKVKEVLSFWKTNPGVKIEPDINIFRELKLRLLNATHTFSSGVCFLSGVDTVRDAMDDPDISKFIDTLMSREISPSVPMEIALSAKREFIHDVQDRFRNPYLHHHWKTIAQNYSHKMKLRCLPLVINHYKQHHTISPLFAFGFAVWIFYMRALKEEDGKYYGKFRGEYYHIDDEKASTFMQLWKKPDVKNIVVKTLGEEKFWGQDLDTMNGLSKAVQRYLQSILERGVRETLKDILQKNY